MTTKFLPLISVIGLASIAVVQAQSPTPSESPAQSPSPAKHRTHEKAAATVSPAETAASPSPAESPAASPKTKDTRKKAKPQAAVSPAASKTAATAIATPATGGGHGLVWVNTATHVYHKEGSRFYGKTKEGKYVSEVDAIKEGNRPAAKEQ